MTPGAGALGEPIEDYERRRIATLQASTGGVVGVANRLPVDRARSLTAAAEVQATLKALVRQEFSALRLEMDAIRHDIKANTEVLKLADVPLEAVADSHERATASFETLRADLVGFQARLAKMEEAVVLMAQTQQLAGQNMLALVTTIERIARGEAIQ